MLGVARGGKDETEAGCSAGGSGWNGLERRKEDDRGREMKDEGRRRRGNWSYKRQNLNKKTLDTSRLRRCFLILECTFV